MPEEKVVELNVACAPEAAISGAELLQTEESAVLSFNAMTKKLSKRGVYENLGRAVMEFRGCLVTRFGYPNDEGLPEHPLYDKGLSEADGICEVLNSSWLANEMAKAERTSRRIHGVWPNFFWQVMAKNQRHFLVSFHDSTFECLAKGFALSIERPVAGSDKPRKWTMVR